MGTTPIYAFPYPDPTDLVRDGAQDFEDLADAVETTINGLPSGVTSLLTPTKGVNAITAKYLVPGYNYATTTNGSLAANRAEAHPVYVSQATTFSEISVEVTSSGAGNARLALYAANANGIPTTLIVDYGQINVGTTGLKTIAGTFVVPAGVSFVAIVTDVIFSFNHGSDFRLAPPSIGMASATGGFNNTAYMNTTSSALNAGFTNLAENYWTNGTAPRPPFRYTMALT